MPQNNREKTTTAAGVQPDLSERTKKLSREATGNIGASQEPLYFSPFDAAFYDISILNTLSI